MKKILFIILVCCLSLKAKAGLMYCEFTVLDVAPFIETQNEFADGILGSEITIPALKDVLG